MALSPQKFREMVFQLLYSKDIASPKETDMIQLLMNELEISKRNVSLAQERANDIYSKLNEIDPKIASASTSYDFDRIQTVAKNILRLGVYELFFDESIPHKVAIAEAMRLARKFGSPESATFINAVLDQLYRLSIGNNIDPKAIEEQASLLEESEKRAKEIAEQKNEESNE